MRQRETTGNDVLKFEFSFHNLTQKWLFGQKRQLNAIIVGAPGPTVHLYLTYLEIILQARATSSSLRPMHELPRRKSFCVIPRETSSSMGNP